MTGGGTISSAGRRDLEIEKGKLAVPAADQPRTKSSNGGFLPDDIVKEILLSLPSGLDIARLRCVCKSWRRFLSDPVFIHDILVHNDIDSSEDDEVAQVLFKGKIYREITVYSLLSYDTLESIYPSDDEDDKPDLPFVPNKVRSRSFEDRDSDDDDIDGDDYGVVNFGVELSIVGCCDGIVCIADKLYARASDIILWNPTTSETKILPRSPFTGDRDGGGDLDGELIGFGCDPETGDYKVIRSISAPGPADDFGASGYIGWDVVEIYSLRQDSWREVTCDYCASMCRPVCYPHTYRGEMLYWWSLNEDGEDLALESFDMGKEVFDHIYFANPTGKDDWVGHSFTLLKGSIVGVFSNHRENEPSAADSCFEIWVLLKFHAAVPWTKLFTFPSFDYDCSFPATWKDGCYFHESGGSLFIYDPRTEETVDYGIEEDRDEEDSMDEVEIVTFVPSEISLSDFTIVG